MKRFVLYCVGLGTPILAMVIAAYLGEWKAAATSNLIGGTYFRVDRWIFKS